jgi:hypothetical protein
MSTTPHTNLWLDAVKNEAAQIRYGIIQIKIQDSRVVSIESTHKLRIDSPSPSNQFQR